MGKSFFASTWDMFCSASVQHLQISQDSLIFFSARAAKPLVGMRGPVGGREFLKVEERYQQRTRNRMCSFNMPSHLMRV